MRKQTINTGSKDVSRSAAVWLDLERLAQVEIISESAEYPIESALISDRGPGWRAAQPGKQTIRLIFDHPLPSGVSCSGSTKRKRSARRNLCCVG